MTIADEDGTRLERCQKRLGYSFTRPELLVCALTHSSCASNRIDSYERMEFLGDAILGFLISEILYQKHPDQLEGDLTHRKSVLVSRDMCLFWSRELGLEDFVMVGKGVKTSGIPLNIVADVFEAVMAAVYLDAGMEAVRNLIIQRVALVAHQQGDQENTTQQKNRLQQHCQKETGNTPLYLLLDEQGPDHCKCYKVSAKVGDQVFTAAWANTKKEAEQRAAANALSELAGGIAPYGDN